jgi:hypothetical protein
VFVVVLSWCSWSLFFLALLKLAKLEVFFISCVVYKFVAMVMAMVGLAMAGSQCTMVIFTHDMSLMLLFIFGDVHGFAFLGLCWCVCSLLS